MTAESHETLEAMRARHRAAARYRLVRAQYDGQKSTRQVLATGLTWDEGKAEEERQTAEQGRISGHTHTYMTDPVFHLELETK